MFVRWKVTHKITNGVEVVESHQNELETKEPFTD